MGYIAGDRCQPPTALRPEHIIHACSSPGLNGAAGSQTSACQDAFCWFCAQAAWVVSSSLLAVYNSK